MEWRASFLTADDVLRMPEIGIEIPVAELYDDVDLPHTESQGRTTDESSASKT